MVEGLTAMAIRRRHIKAVIQFRRAKESEWIQHNPILRDGEPALSTDINKFKIGNGKDHWIDLPYQYGGGGEGTSDYSSLINLPKINRITLIGNKSSSDLGLQEEMETLSEADIDYILYGGI